MEAQAYPDDPGIVDATPLWRWVRPDIIVPDPKQPSGYKLSSQAFEDSRDGTPCSVAIRAETWPAEEIQRRFPGYAIAQIEAGQARQNRQRVLRWPDPDMPGHTYLAGPKDHKTRKALAAAARWIAGARNWDSAVRID